MKKGSIKHHRQGRLIWCFVCKQYKDMDEFYPDRCNPNGRKSLCKVCQGPYDREYQSRYYQDHKEELLPKHRISAMESYNRKQRK